MRIVNGMNDQGLFQLIFKEYLRPARQRHPRLGPIAAPALDQFVYGRANSPTITSRRHAIGHGGAA
jgi:hypothetical protein